MVAFYPGPAGATESELDIPIWESIVAGHPALAELRPDVEALLVRRTDRASSCHLIPVDAAYELVGRLRLHWQGFDGGDRARAELDAFFAEVERKAMPVPQSVPAAPEGGGTP